MSKYWGNNLTEKRLKEIKALGLEERITKLEAKVKALTPKPETETVKVYFYKDIYGDIYTAVTDMSSIYNYALYAIKEVTVTKGEGLEENKSKS